MLSKTEIEYLSGKKVVNDNYRYYLEHSIRSKFKIFSEELPTLISNNLTRDIILREITKTLRENPKTNNIGIEQVSINALYAEGSQRFTKMGLVGLVTK